MKAALAMAVLGLGVAFVAGAAVGSAIGFACGCGDAIRGLRNATENGTPVPTDPAPARGTP